MNIELCEIGIITKPQGLKGHFRVRQNYSNFSILTKVKTVVIRGKDYEVEKVTDRGEFFIFKVKGIESIEQAEDLRNEKIFSKLEVREELEENEFYISDLIGSKVFAGKIFTGEMKNILQYGSADIFVLNNNGKEIMMPFVNGLVDEFDKEHKTLKLNEMKYKEVVWSGDENWYPNAFSRDVWWAKN